METLTHRESHQYFRNSLRQLLSGQNVPSNPGVGDDWIISEISRLINKRSEVLDRLSKETYVVEHCPNCPAQFLVRLVGSESAIIDKKYYTETKDILGFGNTLEEAAQHAFSKKDSKSAAG